MKRNDAVYLNHMADAIRRIESYVVDIDLTQFYGNFLVQDGVIRQLEIMGEATKQLSSTLRDEYPHIPWRSIAGMRDKLIHHYFGVDLEAVWLTVQDDLPYLKQEISKILTQLE